MSLEGKQGFYKLPDKMLLEIFQHLKTQDLCRVEQVCKRFRKVLFDTWKSLYQKVFEYNQPLYNLEPFKFAFISPDKTIYKNPWKESFKQLYRGVHVRTGFQKLTFRDSNLQHFDTIYDALDYVRRNRKNSSVQSLVFLHPSTYNLDYRGTVYIENDIALIGAAPGKNIAKSVIIKDIKNIMFVDKDVKRAYVGYLTLEEKSDASSKKLKAHCLEIHGSPIINHCIIRSSNFIAAVWVSGNKANPLIKNCVISKCGCIGLHVNDSATGIYEDNKISRNSLFGIWITNKAQPTIRRNNIHYNSHAGISIFSDGSGYFEDNEVYDNAIGFRIIDTYSKNITIQKNKISNKKTQGHTQKIGISFCESYGKVEDNNICGHSDVGVQISKESKPVIRSNMIQNNKIGVFVSNKSSGLLEKNYISNNATDNVQIIHSSPTLKRNHIFDGQDCGIYISDRSRGTLDANVIFENAQIGVLNSSKSQPILEKNLIFDNVAAGVEITRNATATLRFNKILYNGSKGLHLATKVPRKLFLKGNKNKICYNNISML